MRTSRGKLLWGGVLQAVAAVAVMALAACNAHAQVQVQNAATVQRRKFHPDSSHTAEQLLHNAALHTQSGQYAEAVDLYQKVLRDHANSMAKVPAAKSDADGSAGLYVQVRQFCQSQIAALPPEARALYRRQADPQAERWLRQGLERSDLAVLRRVVDEAFCSSHADQALEFLGDAAFRQGRFAEARSYYSRLVPEEAQVAPGLVHPDPDVNLALVAAKKILCRAALGADEASKLAAEVREFSKQYPGAEGELAGRKGGLAGILAEATQKDGLAQASGRGAPWPTFAGGPTRSRSAKQTVSVGSFQWTVPLPSIRPESEGSPAFMMGRRWPTQPQSPRNDRELAFHPIVTGDQVILCDDHRVFAYNLSERMPSGPAAEADSVLPVAWDQPLSSSFRTSPVQIFPAVPRYTVTTHGERVYARLGPPSGRNGASYVVAIQNDGEVEGKLLWKASSLEIVIPNRPGGAARLPLAFEGTPLADDSRVYVALTESGTMTSAFVAALDSQSGDLIWTRFLGEATAQVDPMMGMPYSDAAGNRLLTLDGSTLYYQTNLGALAAIDADTGDIRWLATYPTSAESLGDNELRRDLNPAIVHDGVVIIAPSDSLSLFAFDASAGRLLWTSAPLPNIAHLLGVAGGRLFATGNRVWTIDARSGKVLTYWPQGGTGLEGYGRGLLAGDAIYWPTRKEIVVLDQATGLKSDRPSIPLQEAFGTSGGNLAVGEGYLIVAGAETLSVFCENSILIKRYQELIAAAPKDAELHVRLARVAEASGQFELALESLNAALDCSEPGQSLEGQPAGELARSQKFRLLMEVAGRAGAEGRWSDSVLLLDQAVEAARSDKERLSSRLRLAEACLQEGMPEKSVTLLQEVLADERLRLQMVDAGEKWSVRADRLVADRLQMILKNQGVDLYSDYEAKARELFAVALQQKNPHLLLQIAESYPVSSTAPEAILTLARMQLDMGHSHDSARTFKRLLATPLVPREARVQALLGLAETYEDQKLIVPARETLERAQSLYGEVRLDTMGRTVASLVAERLTEPAYQDLGARNTPRDSQAPFSRLWNIRWPSKKSTPICAVGTPPSGNISRLFVCDEKQLSPVNPATGVSPWTVDLGSAAKWVGFLADRVLAATETRVVALEPSSGQLLWSFPSETGPDPSRLDPFAKPMEPDREANPRDFLPNTLSSFHAVGNRLYAIRGERQLVAIDGESGRLDWSYTASAGSLSPHVWLSPHVAIVQTRSPNAITVLDASTGQQRSEFPQPEESQPWVRDPLTIDDDHLAIVNGDQSVSLFDTRTGKLAWSYRDISALPKGGHPRLLTNGQHLLVLRDGGELVSLDPLTGHKKWSRLLGLEDLSDRPEALVLDENRIYCVCGPAPTVTAYSFEDSSVLWRKPLIGPSNGWSLTFCEKSLLAFPTPGRLADESLPALPLVVLRRDDGRLVQRVLLDTEVSALAIRAASGLTLIATQQAAWALGPRIPVDSLNTPR